jgi:predicted Zn-dependent protease
MKGRSSFFSNALCGIAATVLLLSGCRSAESQAQDAFAEYQSAAAAGDLIAARLALLQLVAIEDGVARYWVELGKVQLQLGQYSDAFYAFTRAHELDKGDVAILGILIQLALLSGNVDLAEEKTRLLELVAPANPIINLTAGFVALRRGNIDEANRQADILLQGDPYEPSAKLLKTRVLLAQNKLDEAIALLNEQVRVQASDMMSLNTLTKLYQRKGDWEGVATTSGQMARVSPKNVESVLLYIEAGFRAGRTDEAREASLRLLAPEAPGGMVDRVLTLWAEHWRGDASIAEARRLAAAAGPGQRLAYATFFNAARAPEVAAELVGNAPQLPVTRGNSSANAILARSLALRGRTDEARQLFDSVLRQEPDHVYALRGRTDLYLATARPKSAIRDAQRLVSIAPSSARDRLLLARTYAAAGDRRHLERTLWDAFHEIPADRSVYTALRAHMLARGGVEAAQRVTEEFEQQRSVALNREFV